MFRKSAVIDPLCHFGILKVSKWTQTDTACRFLTRIKQQSFIDLQSIIMLKRVEKVSERGLVILTGYNQSNNVITEVRAHSIGQKDFLKFKKLSVI